MTRGIKVGTFTILLAVMGAGGALACDTGSWLLLGGAARAGHPVVIRGGGFDPGRVLLVWDRSAGHIIGKGKAGTDGRLTATVDIPADAAGSHKIIAVPASAEASATDVHAWTDVVVGEVAASPTAASAVRFEPEAESTASLHRLVAAAYCIGLAIIATVLLRRRRRRARLASRTSEECPSDLDAELVALVEGSSQDTREPIDARR